MDISSSTAAIRGYGNARSLIGTGADAAKTKPDTAGTGDGSAIAKGVESFSDVLKTVETSTQQYARGEADAQSVVQALANAEMALETAVTVRNRVVEAYQELLRMPI